MFATKIREAGWGDTECGSGDGDTGCGTEGGSVKKVYVCSRASVPERVEAWRQLRAQGMAITSSWLEEGTKERADFGNLWQKVVEEIKDADALLAHFAPEDFPLRGALVEIGIALAFGKPVLVALPNVELTGPTLRPLGAWAHHPLVARYDDLRAALEQLGYGDLRI